mgnify:CR=1 FL=1
MLSQPSVLCYAALLVSCFLLGRRVSYTRVNRKVHKWASILILMPLILVLVTGILLLLRKELPIIQPPTQIGVSKSPSLPFEQVLAISKSIPQAQIKDWQHIDRLDVRPSKGVIKIRSKNSWEIQLDAQTGNILQVAYRRSDWLESLHDGTYFHKSANLWLMLPSAILLLILSITGLYLFIYPYVRKWRK